MRTSYEQIFGRNVRRLRELKKVNQEKMGRIAGVSQKTISNLESPDSDISPQMKTVAEVADYFEIHPAMLIMSDITDDSLTDSEVSVMIERFAQLAPEHKRRIMDLIDDLWQLRDSSNS